MKVNPSDVQHVFPTSETAKLDRMERGEPQFIYDTAPTPPQAFARYQKLVGKMAQSGKALAQSAIKEVVNESAH